MNKTINILYKSRFHFIVIFIFAIIYYSLAKFYDKNIEMDEHEKKLQDFGVAFYFSTENKLIICFVNSLFHVSLSCPPLYSLKQ